MKYFFMIEGFYSLNTTEPDAPVNCKKYKLKIQKDVWNTGYLQSAAFRPGVNKADYSLVLLPIK